MLLLTGALMAASVSADFEGGQIGKCVSVAARHLRCSVVSETDQDGRNRQASWYYFRLNAPPVAEVTIDLVDLPGEYNYRPNRGPTTKDTFPVISYDRRSWNVLPPVECDQVEPRYTMRLTAASSPVWIARLAP